VALLIRCLFRVLSWMPLPLLHAAGWLLGWLSFALSGRYRRRLFAHAAQAGVSRRVALASVGESGKLVAELPRLWLGRPVRVDWQGAGHIEAQQTQGSGVLFLTPHLGCFEITAQAYAQRFGATHPMTVLFRPARKPWLRDLVAGARERPGLLTAPTTLAGVKQLIKALKAGQAVGLLPDQVPPDGQGVWAPFFGRDAYTMTLAARLAQQTGAVPLLIWGERLRHGAGYMVRFAPLPEPLPADAEAQAESAAVVNRAMEALIRQCPQQYLWGYHRYKAPRAASPDRAD
jgi:Kdo2-lipid IVA lauroyltransferase/acyltransferase